MISVNECRRPESAHSIYLYALNILPKIGDPRYLTTDFTLEITLYAHIVMTLPNGRSTVESSCRAEMKRIPSRVVKMLVVVFVPSSLQHM